MPQVYWPVADRAVHVVKTLRHHARQRQHVQRQGAGNKQIVRVVEVEPSTNFYAANLELGSIPPLFIHQLGRSRWHIDAQLFQPLLPVAISSDPPSTKAMTRLWSCSP